MRLRQYITEMSIKQVDVDNIVTKSYIKDYLDTSDLEGFLYNYKMTELNMDDPADEYEDMDDDKIMNSQGFIDFVQNHFEDQFEDAKYEISRTIKGSYITIYREMTVNKKWLDNLKKNKHLGIYWSWDKNAAEAHWGKFEKGYRTITLIAKIKENYIDWVDTFAQNIHPSMGEEREIRLFRNTPIKLEAIFVEGEEVDISEIKDKVFKA